MARVLISMSIADRSNVTDVVGRQRRGTTGVSVRLDLVLR
jgi:hypothetical protein